MIRDWKASDWSARMRGPDAEKHRAAFEKWLRDPRNAAAYAKYQSDLRFTENLTRTDVPGADERHAASRSVPLRWAIGAAAVLALGFAWYLQASPRVTDLAGEAATSRALQLADGSAVVLMDGARIETTFTATQRRVTLARGRARFTVAHDAGRPFTVRAGNSRTTALGTVFEIDLRQAHPRIHLIEGAVEVRASGGENAIRLDPGESAEVEGNQARHIASPALAAARDFARAREHPAAMMIAADNLPLGAVIDQANRINAVPIRLADPALRSRALTGRLSLANSAALARKLASALDLDLASGRHAHVLSARPKNSGG